jgi:uncharacterized damage-inducible protein DinB
MMDEILRQHLEYSAWASRRLLQAVLELTPEEQTRDFGTSDRSILGTLTHIMAADRIWLARVQHQNPGPFVQENERDLGTVHAVWNGVMDGWSQFASRLAPERVDEIVRYKDLKGREWAQPLWQIVMHVVNHGTHHRGQVSGFLRILGRTPPAVDLAVYYRERM